MAPADHVQEARAVYDASAQRYVDFVGTEISEATEAPLERALLTDFAASLAGRTNPRVADLGCGPGRVAALLSRHRLAVTGVDVSAGMLKTARRAHPGLGFAAGRLDALPFASGALGGVVSWYSIIHTPPEQLTDVAAEIGRVLGAGGSAFLAFQAGAGEGIERADAHGTGLPLTSYRHRLDEVSSRLATAGLEIEVTTERPAQLEHESCPQAFVIAAGRR